MTGAVQQISEGWEGELSSDGKEILLVDGTQTEIRIAGSQGESPRTFFKAADGDAVGSVHWLPGGKRIGYLTGKFGAPDAEIQTRDLRGTDMKSITHADIYSVVFAADGRVFYTIREVQPQVGASLWSAAVDPSTGEIKARPVKVATWPAVTSVPLLTISADGRRLGLTKTSAQSDVYQLQLGSGGNSVTSSRRLTTDTAADWPSQWTHDGSSFLFSSDRAGAMHVFQQPLADETPQPIATGTASARVPQQTADGKWILYVEMTSEPEAARIMRVPAAGGPAEQVMIIASRLATARMDNIFAVPDTTGTGARTIPDLRCPPHAADRSCFVLQGVQNGASTRSVLFAIDPATGRARELATLADTRAGAMFWDMSPDGATVAFGQFDWAGGDTITLLDVAGGNRRVIRPKDVKNLSDVAWAADGRSLYATVTTIRGGELLHIALDGTARSLRSTDSQVWLSPRPSPDGRSLLAALVQSNANAWVIDR